MTYSRTTTVDSSPTGDTTKQAVLDLDTDLSAAFVGLNDLDGKVAAKIAASTYIQPSGTLRLDSDGKVALAQMRAGFLPVGTVIAYGGATVPVDGDWLECDGTEITISDHLDLYAVVGTIFGTPVDPLKFKLPDLRGEFVRGWDHGRGIDTGRALGSSQAASAQTYHEFPINTGVVIGEIPGDFHPRNVALMYIIKWR